MFKILSFNRSNQWKKLRDKHLKKQPYCQACGKQDHLDVHHIEPVSWNPEKELDPDNLITLCSKYCHFVFGHLMDYQSYNVNIKEDCKVYHNKIINKPIKLENQNVKKNFFRFATNTIGNILSCWNNRS